MDWFQRITGFAESDYETTQSLLHVDGEHLVSTQSHQRWGIGRFETPSLGQLRGLVGATSKEGCRTRFRAISGDVQDLHCDLANSQALFQVASQFNALEMVGPSVAPEHGVTRYADDHTQGPACAIAAGAATIWRNYLVPLPGGIGQRTDRQVDTLCELGDAFGNQDGELWQMRNGYALCTDAGLDRVDQELTWADREERERLLGLLRVGLHWDVEVTIAQTQHTVVQAFCSALPCSYSPIPLARWEQFARLVLEAAYEATLLAGTLNLRRTGCPIVYLTRLGGGAFGNADSWIFDAIAGALRRNADSGLDVRLVSFGHIPREYQELQVFD